MMAKHSHLARGYLKGAVGGAVTFVANQQQIFWNQAIWILDPRCCYY
jgi:hypothetical protein